MGLLRLFLALSVVNGHVTALGEHPPLGWAPIWMQGYVAVCCFFIISGFYMAMVLDQRYRGAAVRFYANRLLRLMPLWWAVLAFQIIGNESGWLAEVPGINTIHNVMQPSIVVGAADRAIGAAANLLLFPAALAGPFASSKTWAWTGLASGQMYTVGLEILFYVMAPLLARLATRTLLVVTCLAAAIHFAPLAFGLSSRPWQYDFFPTILVFFLLGIAAYRIQARLPRFPDWWGWPALGLIVGYCWLFNDDLARAFTDAWAPWQLYLAMPLLVPVLFRASRRSVVDRFIGNLSYPLYACHFVVIAWSARHGLGPQGAAAVALGVAAGLAVLIERPMERLRGIVWGGGMCRPPENLDTASIPILRMP